MTSAEPHLAGDTVLQSAVLEDLATAVNYRRWLAGLAQPWLGDDPLEIGSGLGDYAAEWATGGTSITASEADHSRLGALRRRFAGDSRVQVRELAVPIAERGGHSAVVALNVLEHIDDDVGALRAFAGLVRPGGRVVLVVPAFPMLYSRFDAEIGHARRYRRQTLTCALTAAGLTVERLHHVNAVGLVAWFVGMRLLGRRPADGPALRLFDRVVPLLAAAERRRPPPFGQSLFAVASVRIPRGAA